MYYSIEDLEKLGQERDSNNFYNQLHSINLEKIFLESLEETLEETKDELLDSASVMNRPALEDL